MITGHEEISLLLPPGVLIQLRIYSCHLLLNSIVENGNELCLPSCNVSFIQNVILVYYKGNSALKYVSSERKLILTLQPRKLCGQLFIGLKFKFCKVSVPFTSVIEII